MNELIKVNYESDRPTVMGRDLYEALEVKSKYADWFPRMCEYGFTEVVDFNLLKKEKVQNEGNRNVTREVVDHQLTLDMAKEICMLQRSAKGREFRQYFIEIEKKWNTPEAVMARALQYAEKQLENVKRINLQLADTVAVQEQQIAELKPKASYYDVILNCKDLVSITEIAKDYGKSAKWFNALLHDLGVQFKQGEIWLIICVQSFVLKL